jgi:riboflavin kinase/FMN adenylyltransferase
VRTLVGIEALDAPRSGSVVAIGTFDGVHLGHRGLIMQTMERAGELDAAGVVLTWDRHPATILRPDKVPALLASPERKLELLEAAGIDVVAILAFDQPFSQMSPEEFIDRVLVKGLRARAIYVGRNWRFGHKAAGNVDLLQATGAASGFEVDGVELQTVAGDVVSSSRVRRAITDGDMELARVLLGRPFDIDGRVVEGAARGKDLGFPTANLQVDPRLARPPLGIYAGMGRLGELSYEAAISVGVNPTFGGTEGTSPVSVEAHLLDFNDEIYGQTLRLEFHTRLRDEKRFDSVDDLITQIQADVTATHAFFERKRVT